MSIFGKITSWLFGNNEDDELEENTLLVSVDDDISDSEILSQLESLEEDHQEYIREKIEEEEAYYDRLEETIEEFGIEIPKQYWPDSSEATEGDEEYATDETLLIDSETSEAEFGEPSPNYTEWLFGEEFGEPSPKEPEPEVDLGWLDDSPPKEPEADYIEWLFGEDFGDDLGDDSPPPQEPQTQEGEKFGQEDYSLDELLADIPGSAFEKTPLVDELAEYFGLNDEEGTDEDFTPSPEMYASESGLDVGEFEELSQDELRRLDEMLQEPMSAQEAIHTYPVIRNDFGTIDLIFNYIPKHAWGVFYIVPIVDHNGTLLHYLLVERERNKSPL